MMEKYMQKRLTVNMEKNKRERKNRNMNIEWKGEGKDIKVVKRFKSMIQRYPVCIIGCKEDNKMNKYE